MHIASINFCLLPGPDCFDMLDLSSSIFSSALSNLILSSSARASGQRKCILTATSGSWNTIIWPHSGSSLSICTTTTEFWAVIDFPSKLTVASYESKRWTHIRRILSLMGINADRLSMGCQASYPYPWIHPLNGHECIRVHIEQNYIDRMPYWEWYKAKSVDSIHEVWPGLALLPVCYK